MVVVLFAFCLGCLLPREKAMGGASDPAVLRAERFELVDSKGAVQGSWWTEHGEIHLRLGSLEGNGVVEIFASEGGAALFRMRNRDAISKLSAGLDPQGVIFVSGRGP